MAGRRPSRTMLPGGSDASRPAGPPGRRGAHAPDEEHAMTLLLDRADRIADGRPEDDFLDGDFVEELHAAGDGTPSGLLDTDGDARAVTPTIIASLIFCPAITGLSIAYCTG